MFVSIDPGVDSGWALWRSGVLVACGLGAPESCPLHVVEDISAVWVESQRIYPRSGAAPNDILKLARDAGEWVGAYRAVGVAGNYVEPNVWKGGSLPKEISHRRIWAALTAPERAIVDAAGRGVAPSKRHNLLDAIGIGLYVLRRGGR